jgi:TonB family protein
MSRVVLRLCRFTIVVHAILVAALLPFPASPAQQEPAPANVQTLAGLALQLSGELQKKCVKRVVVLDFEDPNGKVTPFGTWLADGLSSAPGNPWAPIEVESDGSAIAGLQALFDDPGTLGQPEDKRAAIGRVLKATPVSGSYSAAENGIGVTIAGGGVQLIGKIALTDEMKSHLVVPLDSLVPSDGIFEADRGGISTPRCEYCPNPQFSDEAVKNHLQGTVALSAVIDVEGRATAISIVKALGGGLDERAVEAVRTWRLKPALNVDGKPVAMRTPIEVVFRLYKKD